MTLLGSLEWESHGPAGFKAIGKLSSDQGNVSLPIQVALELSWPEGYRPDIEAIRSHLLSFGTLYPPFRLIREESHEKSFTYVLEPLIAGELPITFWNIPFIPEDKNNHPVEIASGVFFYSAVLPSLEDNLLQYASPLFPLDQPMPLQPDGQSRRQYMTVSPALTIQQASDIHSRMIPWTFLLAATLAAGAYLFLKTRKPRITKHRQAHHAQAALELAKNLYMHMSQGSSIDAQAYFSTLDEAIRYHLKEKYGIPATAQTIEEALLYAHDQNLLRIHQTKELSQFLLTSEAARFGGYRPSLQESKAALDVAQAFLNP
jgi:hypothetical protein